MKKFKFLVKFGLKKRIYRKAFVIANIFVGLLIMIIVNIPTIISLFDNDEAIENINILIADETAPYDFVIANDLATRLNEPFKTAYEGYDFYLITSGNALDEEQFWNNDSYDIMIIFSGDMSNPEVNLYSKYTEHNPLIISTIQLLVNQYQIDNYMPPTLINHVGPDYEDPAVAILISSLSTFLILPMFMLITLATQFIGVDIIEEKSTKAIETIIASVPAKIHFLSKISSSLLFIVIQGILLLAFAVIATLLGNLLSSQTGIGGEQMNAFGFIAEVFPNWRSLVVLSILFMIFGTVFYLIIASLFASMATTQEDYQQFQSPMMLLLVGGFYIGIFAPMAGGDSFLRIMAFVPVFTPMVAPVAYASGALSLAGALIALSILILFTIGTLYLVAPVYRVAILSYEQTKFFKRIANYFKKGFNSKSQ